MTLRNGEQFDRTDLSIDTAYNTGVIHKDYIAHCLRWTYVCDWLAKTDRRYGEGPRYKNVRVFDAGCGKDLQLYKALCSNKMGAIPHYTGVDINKLEMPDKFARRKLPYTLLSETDMLSVPHIDAELITSFEVLEHVPFDYCVDAVKHLYNASNDNTTFIVSTPVYDPHIGMAANHINEMTREVFRDVLEEAGWVIKENYGTFASKKDYYNNMTKEHRDVFDELHKYYNSHYISTIFAPLYPQFSRNNLWVCEKG